MSPTERKKIKCGTEAEDMTGKYMGHSISFFSSIDAKISSIL